MRTCTIMIEISQLVLYSTSIVCTFVAVWSGVTYSQMITATSPDSCTHTNPCRNGGDCNMISSSPDTYSCDCPQFFSGRDCEFNDSNTQVGFELTSYDIGESDAVLEIQFIRTGDLSRNTSIEISTYSEVGNSHPPATPPDDYTRITSKRLEFGRNDRRQQTKIFISNDQDFEETEVFYVLLSVRKGGVLLHDIQSAEVTIYDDDFDSWSESVSGIGLTFVSLKVDYIEVDEDIGTVTIDIIRYGNLDVDTTIYLSTEDETATHPTDYTQIMRNRIDFSPGQDFKSRQVVIIDDSVAEMNLESMYVTITAPSEEEIGTFDTVMIGIRDNDGNDGGTGIGGTDPVVLGAIIGAVLLVLLIATVAVLLCLLHYRTRRRLSRKSDQSDSMQMEEPRYIKPGHPYRSTRQHGITEPSESSSVPPKQGRRSNQAYSHHSGLREQDSSFPRDQLRLIEEIGRGSFATVIRAEALSIIRSGRTTVVAVKMLKETANDNDRSDLLKELKVFKMLEPHPHVVTMLGYCIDEEPMYIILEYLANGNLQSYLQRIRNEEVTTESSDYGSSLPPKEILTYGLQIAKGMEYLSSKKCIHRDLATRNILLGAGNTCKVSDFGLARDIEADRQYEMKSKGRVPVRWLALECLLRNVYTSKSDIWSFGILLWELVTLGSHPYPGLSSTDVISELKKGYRLPRPDHCSQEIYKFMMQCWMEDPDKRPTFSEVVGQLDDMILDAEGYLMMTNFREDQYEYLVPNVNTKDDTE